MRTATPAGRSLVTLHVSELSSLLAQCSVIMTALATESAGQGNIRRDKRIQMTRGYVEPPAADRAVVVPQQAALRRTGRLRTPPEPGTARPRASRRGVLGSAVSRPGCRPGAAQDPQPGPVP